MTRGEQSRVEALEAEELELVFARFDLDDVWILGSRIVERARAAGHKITVDIRRQDVILFRAALPGSTPDQQHWVNGKSATTLRLERSTAILEAEFGVTGFDPDSIGWLPHGEYVISAGSVPVRVAGVGVVAAVTVSGLASAADHDLIIASMREHLVRQEPM